MDDDGMRIDVLEETLARLRAEGRTPKFIYTIPNFQNPGGVTMSLERRRALVRIAAEQELVVLEDNPYGLLRYEGEPLPTLYSLDGGRYVIYLGTFSKILSAGLRLGWAAAPGPILERLNLGKQAADLCSSSLTQYFVAAYFAHRDWRTYLTTLRALYRRRRDVMLAALEEFLPAEAAWTRPEGGLFIWARLPDYIDTTDLLARALREHVAFVPGRAAYLDGRGGSEMRLNFSGVSEDEIREGVRRIGKVVAEQVALYGTLTGVKPAPKRRTPRSCRCGGGRPREGRGPEGRLVAGAHGVAALGRAGRGRAGAARARGAADRRRRRPRRPADRRAPGRRVRRAARPRRRGRHRPGAARAGRRPVHGLRARRLHPLHGQGRGQARAARRRDPDAGLLRLQPGRVRGPGRGARAAGDRGAARLPDRGQARRPGLGARDQVRAHGRGRARRAGGRVLLRHEGDAGALRPGPRPRRRR